MRVSFHNILYYHTHGERGERMESYMTFYIPHVKSWIFLDSQYHNPQFSETIRFSPTTNFYSIREEYNFFFFKYQQIFNNLTPVWQ